jgi:hypothetical protein
VILAATGPTAAQATVGKGWVYNSATGEIIVNSSDPDESGNVNYDQY